MNSNVIIIAEAGVNHNGDIDLAYKLIDKAKESGADYIKFQTFITELNLTKTALKANYQVENTQSNESQFDMVKKLELSFEDFVLLHNYCQKVGINFLSTGFDYPSIDFLDNLNPPFYKIPSGEITNKPYLEYIAGKGKDIILSTGMADISEIIAAIELFERKNISKDRITILHCNTEYPTPMEDVNLKAMNFIAKELGVNVGYSDHTLGIEVPIAAVALGASVIEKHFTLDRSMPGPDHAASLEPDELKLMVDAIRNIEKAISGSGIKEPSKSEQKNKSVARKSLHSCRDLKAGSTLYFEDLIALRPGDGISPMEIDNIVGKKINKNILAGSKILYTDFE